MFLDVTNIFRPEKGYMNRYPGSQETVYITKGVSRTAKPEATPPSSVP